MSQPPRILTTNGLEVPPDFPFEPYEAIHSGSRPRSKEAADVVLRTEFGSAWSAVGNRFVAAAYYSDSFKQSADKEHDEREDVEVVPVLGEDQGVEHQKAEHGDACGRGGRAVWQVNLWIRNAPCALANIFRWLLADQSRSSKAG